MLRTLLPALLAVVTVPGLVVIAEAGTDTVTFAKDVAAIFQAK